MYTSDDVGVIAGFSDVCASSHGRVSRIQLTSPFRKTPAACKRSNLRLNPELLWPFHCEIGHLIVFHRRLKRIVILRCCQQKKKAGRCRMIGTSKTLRIVFDLTARRRRHRRQNVTPSVVFALNYFNRFVMLMSPVSPLLPKTENSHHVLGRFNYFVYATVSIVHHEICRICRVHNAICPIGFIPLLR